MPVRFLARRKKPVNLALPAITGSAITGQTLTRTLGTWSSTASTYATQWQRDAAGNGVAVDIAGATGATRVLAAGDTGNRVRVRVIASTSTGQASEPAYSDWTAIVGAALAAPDNVTPPAFIDTTPSVDDTISTSSITPGTWTGNPVPTLSYVLKVGGVTKTMPYTILVGDLGDTLVMEETATNSQGAVMEPTAATQDVRDADITVYDPADNSEAPVFTFTVDVTALSGTVAADTVNQPHFDHPQLTVISNTFFTTASQKYIYPTSSVNLLVGRGKYHSRDHSVQSFQPRGHFFVRMTPAGKAWYAEINHNSPATGTCNIGIVTGFTEAGGGTYTPLWSTTNLAGMGINWTQRAADNYEYRLKAVGWDVTFEFYDGTTWRTVHTVTTAEGAWLHIEDGFPAIKAGAGPYGVQTIVFTYDDTPVSLFSDPSAGIYDARDFGAKYLTTTGTISAASNSLTVASSAGFAIGDSIVIEIGGEPGAGALGTKGVGGTDPALSYANAAAMNADVSKPAGTRAWLVDTGDQYQWSTFTASAWARILTVAPQLTYQTKAVPKAHVTTITDIPDATHLTLAAPALEAATGANVYFDNQPVISWFGLNSLLTLVPTDKTFRLPGVVLPIGKIAAWASARNGWTFMGAGSGIEYSDTVFGTTGETELWAPFGAPSGALTLPASNGMTVRDLHIHGNAYLTGFGLNWAQASETSLATSYPHGLLMNQAFGCLVENVKVTQSFQKAVSFSYGTNNIARNNVSVKTDPITRYIQWEFDSSDGSNNQFIDCECRYTWMSCGFEPWRDTGSSFTRCVGENVVSSSNGASNVLYQDLRVIVRADTRYSNDSMNVNNPILNCNTNAGASGIGTITGMVVLYEDYYDASDNQPIGVVINTAVNGWTIEDSVFEMLPYDATGVSNGAVGINCTGNELNANGVRVIGTTAGTWVGNINAYSGTGSDISNSIADRVVNIQAGGTSTSNQTNAAAGTDRTPTAVSFTPVTGATPGEYYTSNTVVISGINALLQNANITANGQMIWNGSGLLRGRDHFMFKLIKDGDTIAVRGQASALAATLVRVTLSLGTGLDYNFDITTA